MIRLETETGYWLIAHVDHARLAGEFAAQWGNASFLSPEPRTQVLRGITHHDDGWAARDQHPQITRQGKPSAFSVELVGKYSAFEEIDLADYLAVRERAVRLAAEQDPYAALLISMHTYNLLTARTDRSRMQPEQLPQLDTFLSGQLHFQEELRAKIATNESLSLEQRTPGRIEQHFRLLQACDNLSLLSCVDYPSPGDLLHLLPQADGRESVIQVERLGERQFRLSPYPFHEGTLVFALSARHVEGKHFRTSDDLAQAFRQAEIARLPITIVH